MCSYTEHNAVWSYGKVPHLLADRLINRIVGAGDA